MSDDTPLYLIDADTGVVSQGPISHDPADTADHARQVEAHTHAFPHRRFVVGPHVETDAFADYHWVRALMARHDLPAICGWAQVTVRERPADDLLVGWQEGRCTARPFCPGKPLRLVTWTSRCGARYHGEPHRWWRRAVCNDHLDVVVKGLVARELDGSPDSPRHIGVLVPVEAVVSSGAVQP
jgi:hypothetical protein